MRGMKENRGRMENWVIRGRWDVDRDLVVFGNIHSDTTRRFADGDGMHTSTLVSPHKEYKEGDVVETRNSSYTLGKERL